MGAQQNNIIDLEPKEEENSEMNSNANMPVATFDEMDVAIDNYTVGCFINYLNGNRPVSGTFKDTLKYAFREFKFFAEAEAELKPGHLNQFVEMFFDIIESRAWSLRKTITENGRNNIELIKSKVKNIDDQFVNDFNEAFKNNTDTIDSFSFNKYLNEEENEMNEEKKVVSNYSVNHGDGTVVDTKQFDDGSQEIKTTLADGTVDVKHTEPDPDFFEANENKCECGCSCQTPDEEDFAELQECEGCCCPDSSIGAVYHAPVINFNAPIINLNGADDQTLGHMRDLLIDFYSLTKGD